MAWVGAVVKFVAAIWPYVKMVAAAVYVIKLWEAKKKADRSPTYGFDITTQCTNELPVPIVYGKVKAGGNIVWSRTSFDQTKIYAIVAFSEGEIEGFEDVRANDILISELPGSSYTPYLGTPTQLIDERCPGDEVGFNKDNNYRKTLVTLPTGDYTAADLAEAGLISDYGDEVPDYGGSWMSSVRVNHHRVTLYSGENFDGESLVLTEDVPSLSALSPNLNDRVYSLKIESIPYVERIKCIGGMRNVAYIAFTIKASSKISGGMPNFTAIVKGRKVRVWEYESWVTRYTGNPAWHLLDLLTHTRYGGGYTDNQINIESLKTAAGFCDERAVGWFEPRFTEGIIIDWVESLPDIVDQIRLTCRGYVISINGTLVFKIEQPEEPSQHFSMDDIVPDSLEIYMPGKDEEWQKVSVVYCEPNQNWAKIPAQSVDESNPLNPVKKDFTIVGVNRFVQASQLAYFYRVYSKYCRFSGKFKTTIRALNRTPGDVITISDDIMGWVNKPVRILEIRHAGDHGHEIFFREYNATIYNDELGSAEPTPTYTTLPSKHTAPPDPTELTVVESTYATNSGVRITGVKVTFIPAIYMHYSYTLVEISADGGVTWRTEATPPTGECFIPGLEIGKSYIIKATTVNVIGLKSEGVSLPIIITGYDLPPAAPANLAYNWDSQDLKVWWGAVYQNNDYSATVDIKDYKVEVYVGGVLKRTEESIQGNLYTYTYAKNIADNGTPENGHSPATAVTINVYTRDFGGNLSTATQIACGVPIPTAPTLAANIGIAQITLIADLSNVQLQKYQKLQIKASQTDGFNPETEGTLIHNNPATVFNHAVDTGSTWHYRARIVDMFGQTSPWSAQVSATADKLDESEFLAEVLRLETTSEVAPTSGTLANLHDGTDISSATFDQATWIEDKFVGEQRFSYFRIRTAEAVNFYIQYYNQDTETWVDCCGSAASPKTSLADQNYDVQITPIVAARRIRVQVMAAATVKEIRFCTVGQYTDLYADKIKAGMIEANSLQIGREVQAVPTPLAVNTTDHLWHFDNSLNSTRGIAPIAGAVATLRPGEGKFGGAVAVEKGTTNLLPGLIPSTLNPVPAGYHVAHRFELTANTYDAVGAVSISAQPNTAYTLSYYARLVSGSVVSGTQMYIGSDSQGIQGVAFKSLHTVLNNNWQRFVVTGVTDATATTITRAVFRVQTGETGCVVEIADWQLEVSDFATSFAETTRAAGVLQYDAKQLNINTQYGAVSWYCTDLASIGGRVFIAIGDYTGVRTQLQKLNNLLILRVNGTSYDGPSLTWDGYAHIVLSWTPTNIVVYLNGQSVITAATGLVVGNLEYFAIGCRYDAGWSGFANALFDEIRLASGEVTADMARTWCNFNAPFVDPQQIMDDTQIASATTWNDTTAGTINYRTSGEPSNAPTPTACTVRNNPNGSINIELDWGAYVQGAKKADMLILFWREDGAEPKVNDNKLMFNVNETAASSYIFQGLPAKNYAGSTISYSFGIAAARRTENGLEIGTIQAPTSSPDWRGVSSANAGIDAGGVPISGGNGSVTIDSTGLKTYDGANLQCSVGTDGKFSAGGGAVKADADGFHGYDPQAGYVKTFDITPRGELKDKDGYPIIDINGRFNGKVLMHGMLSASEAETRISLGSSYTVISGKSQILLVWTLGEPFVMPKSDSTKTMKCLGYYQLQPLENYNGLTIFFGGFFYQPGGPIPGGGGVYKNVLPAGTYSNLELVILHGTSGAYVYTDGTKDAFGTEFECYYELREINT
jgi:hypothetical protein